MSLDPVVVYQAASTHQAHLLQQMLAQVGLQAWVESPVDQHFGQTDLSASPRVVVRRQDVEEARRIAEEFDQLLNLPPTDSEEPDPTEEKSAGEIVEAWPRCPRCDAPRNAECLLCGAAKDFFPAAYQQEGEQHGLYFCETCDDVAELRFFRRCHRCAHDYGAGHEPATLPRDEDERRAWRLLFVMLAGGALIALYFSWLFRR